MAEWTHVFVVMRYDPPLSGRFDREDLELHIVAKEVVWSEEAAEREVERLNAINGPSGSHYFFQPAKLWLDK